MDLTSLQTIQQLLKKHGLRPNKRLGQNFLIDRATLDQFIDTADLTMKDTVIEIGPGLGTLTVQLAKHAKKVIAVEKDKKLIPILNEVARQNTNIEIVNKDILEFNPPKNGLYTLAGNIPYYLTSRLLRVFLESDYPPQNIILIVQKEVAQRICAKPPEMSILSISVQFYAEPRIISYVLRSSFWPMPDVDSAIIRICPVAVANSGNTNPSLFFRIVKAGFSSPRKQLANNLSRGLKIPRRFIEQWLARASIDLTARAETLTVNQWKALVSLSKPTQR